MSTITTMLQPSCHNMGPHPAPRNKHTAACLEKPYNHHPSSCRQRLMHSLDPIFHPRLDATRGPLHTLPYPTQSRAHTDTHTHSSPAAKPVKKGSWPQAFGNLSPQAGEGMRIPLLLGLLLFTFFFFFPSSFLSLSVQSRDPPWGRLLPA